MTDLIDDSLSRAPVMDRDGYPYLIHPLTDGVPRCPPALLRAWTEWACKQSMLDDATVVLAPEAMALPLAAGIALARNLPYVVLRKRRYGLEGEEVAYCETGYAKSCLYLNGVGPEDKVVVVDDVLSTGGTLGSILGLLQERSIPCLGALVFLDKGKAASTLSKRHGVPVLTMRRARIESGAVRILPHE